jgi:carbon-monoxide dehydrogenase medium subunit
LRIGAGVRLETARTHALVRTQAPLLAQALDQLGAAGVRRLGTLGGNIGWGEGDCCPVLLAMDAQVELADGRREPLEAVLQRPVRPLMLAFWLPAADSLPPMVFEKVGHRAAFSPARLRMALRWRTPDRGCAVDRIAAAAPGLPVHRLHAVERLLAEPRPTLAGIRAACGQSLPPDLAAIASRLIAGHCGLPLAL